jgi:hypothetical protein
MIAIFSFSDFSTPLPQPASRRYRSLTESVSIMIAFENRLLTFEHKFPFLTSFTKIFFPNKLKIPTPMLKKMKWHLSEKAVKKLQVMRRFKNYWFTSDGKVYNYCGKLRKGIQNRVKSAQSKLSILTLTRLLPGPSHQVPSAKSGSSSPSFFESSASSPAGLQLRLTAAFFAGGLFSLPESLKINIVATHFI